MTKTQKEKIEELLKCEDSLEFYSLPLTEREIKKDNNFCDKRDKYTNLYILYRQSEEEKMCEKVTLMDMFFKADSDWSIITTPTKKEIKKERSLWNKVLKYGEKHRKYKKSVINKYASKYPELLKKMQSYLKFSDDFRKSFLLKIPESNNRGFSKIPVKIC